MHPIMNTQFLNGLMLIPNWTMQEQESRYITSI